MKRDGFLSQGFGRRDKVRRGFPAALPAIILPKLSSDDDMSSLSDKPQPCGARSLLSFS
jgi:hypothetical protein